MNPITKSFFYPGKELDQSGSAVEMSAIENLPIKHVSPSALRCYLTDRQAFFCRYVRLEFDFKGGAAMVEGSAYHKVLELYWTAKMNQPEKEVDLLDFVAEGESLIHAEDAEGRVEWGKTGSVEKSVKAFKQAVNFYRAELPEYNPVGVEQKIVAGFKDENDSEMPLPIKTFSDLVSAELEEIDIVDHKMVTSFVNEDDPQPAFELQAACNFFTVRAEYGKPPRKMIFDQLKKSKNTNGDPQRKPYEIQFFDSEGAPHPCLKRFVELYRRMLCEISGLPLIDADTGVVRFMPNPFAQFGWKESWQDFCEEVDNGKTWDRDMIKVAQENAYGDDGAEAADI